MQIKYVENVSLDIYFLDNNHPIAGNNLTMEELNE